jgi:chromosome segregation ATPase
MASYENVKGIRIEIGGDATPLYTALNEASQKTKEFEANLQELNKALKNATGDAKVELLGKKFETLSNIVESCKKEVDILKQGLSSAELKFKNGDITEEQFNQIAKATELAQKQLDYYVKEFDKFKDVEGNVKATTKAMKEAEDVNKALHDAFAELNVELAKTDIKKQPEKWRELYEAVETTREFLNKHNETLEKTHEEMYKARHEAEQTASAMETFDDAMKKAGDSTEDFGDDIGSAEEQFGDLKKGILEGGVGLKVMNEAFQLLKQGMHEALQVLQEYLSNLYPASQEMQDMAKSGNEFIKSIKDQKAEMKLSASQLEIQKNRIIELNNKIKENARTNKDSKTEQAQLKIEVEKLNDALGEEVFHINNVTGGLIESNQAVEDSIETYRRRALIQYELNAYIEAYARYKDAEAKLEEQSSFYSNIANNSKQELQRTYEELGKEYERHLTLYNELTEEEAQYVAESEKQFSSYDTFMKEHIDSVIAKTKEYRDKNAEYYDSIQKKIKDTNKKINDESATSLEERLQILKENGQAILNYESNLAFLRTMQMQMMNGDQKKALDEFIKLMSDGSEESMQILNLMVKDFKEKGGETAWEFIYEFTREDIPNSVYNIGTQTVTKFAEGMHDSKNKVQKVADEIASIVRNTFQKKFTIKEVHGGAGMYVTDMAQGGIITEPTYIRAGEMGAEAILPLDKLAGIITSTMNNNGGAVGNYTMNVYPQSMSPSEQETLFEKFDARFGASTSRRNI